MIGVLAAKTPSGRRVYLAAMSGFANFPAGWEAAANGAGLIVCTDIPAATMAIRSVDSKGRTIAKPLSPGLRDTGAASNPPGQCAAPKLVQAALRAGYTIEEMTEIWWDPDGVNPNLVNGTVYSSCETCQNNVCQMLCTTVRPGVQ
jgi:hypothetical protein